jgi:hypothetical protein
MIGRLATLYKLKAFVITAIQSITNHNSGLYTRRSAKERRNAKLGAQVLYQSRILQVQENSPPRLQAPDW